MYPKDTSVSHSNIKIFLKKSFFRFTLLLSSYVNINPSPTNVSNNSISLNTLPFDNCDELNMPSECSSSDSCKAHIDSKWIIFEQKGLTYFTLECQQSIYYLQLMTLFILQNNEMLP